MISRASPPDADCRHRVSVPDWKAPETSLVAPVATGGKTLGIQIATSGKARLLRTLLVPYFGLMRFGLMRFGLMRLISYPSEPFARVMQAYPRWLSGTQKNQA